MENCISKNIESFAMKVPSFQGIFRTSWKQRSNKNQLFQGTFSRFLQLFQGTFHWFLQFFQGTFEFFTSTLFWFKQTNSRNQGGIPPWFLEFVCLNQKRVLVKNSKVPWKNCKNQWKVPWKSCKNRENVPWKSWFLFDLCFQEVRNIPWKEGTFIANDSIFLLMQFSIVMI